MNISELFLVPLEIFSEEYFDLFSALLLVIYEEYFWLFSGFAVKIKYFTNISEVISTYFQRYY